MKKHYKAFDIFDLEKWPNWSFPSEETPGPWIAAEDHGFHIVSDEKDQWGKILTLCNLPQILTRQSAYPLYRAEYRGEIFDKLPEFDVLGDKIGYHVIGVNEARLLYLVDGWYWINGIRFAAQTLEKAFTNLYEFIQVKPNNFTKKMISNAREYADEMEKFWDQKHFFDHGQLIDEYFRINEFDGHRKSLFLEGDKLARLADEQSKQLEGEHKKVAEATYLLIRTYSPLHDWSLDVLKIAKLSLDILVHTWVNLQAMESGKEITYDLTHNKAPLVIADERRWQAEILEKIIGET